VFSNNVFEHVPREVLQGIFDESRRVLRDGGLAVHAINCGDHYAYFDRNITFINYLAYSERDWQFWNPPLQYQNRLRPIDFVEVATQSGFDVRLRKGRVRAELKSVLAGMTLAPEFQKYSVDDLCATSIMLGAINPPRPV
jgi:hypothetical protein